MGYWGSKKSVAPAPGSVAFAAAPGPPPTGVDDQLGRQEFDAVLDQKAADSQADLLVQSARRRGLGPKWEDAALWARGKGNLGAIRMQRLARSSVSVASEYKQLLSVRGSPRTTPARSTF